ncbi:hypothetical protein VTK73DRAFT_8647 [Phialemonium thermophilum]|uniref:Uncharacterized protein n=1 Tax=Phialemonium thermophilum TaxID=223376 RepID=A0ABR3W7C6_9PEZI
MSGNQSQQSAPVSQRHLTVDEIVRSILDDRPPSASISPSGELYRAIERYQQAFGSVQQDVSAVRPAGSSMSTGSPADLRRRFNQDPQDLDTPARGPTLPSINDVSTFAANRLPLPPLRSLGTRRPSSSMSTPSGSNGRSSRHPARESNLEDANSQLLALLQYDSHVAASSSTLPDATTSYSSQDHGEDGRRAKRRRLDSERTGSSFRSFRYGKYGQVEPGELVMEIVSCDGGLYSNEASYAAENILKDDASVYCTKGNRCNIVLKHQGGTIFDLKELVIKAPGFNYSSPVREGMVFVAMESDELLARTAQFQIQYIPNRCPEHRSTGRSSRRLPAIYSIRHHEDRVVRLLSRQRNQYTDDMDDDNDDDDDDDEDDEENQSDEESGKCSDDESDTPRVTSDLNFRRPRRRPFYRIGSLPFESDGGEDAMHSWDVLGGGSAWDQLDELARRHYGRSYQAGDLADVSLAEARETAQIATQEAVRAVGGELMTPLAHFHIEKDKTKCTIRFDPPVSGRFILLKMWSSHHDPLDNIDIQGVVAKGFAGPRYCPSVEFRCIERLPSLPVEESLRVMIMEGAWIDTTYHTNGWGLHWDWV